MRRFVTIASARSAAMLVRRPRACAAAFSTLPDGVEALPMPALSPTMTTGSISAWLHNEGAQINAGDVLCQIETDKAVVDYEMTDDAVLAAIVFQAGAADVPVGATLAYTVEDMDAYEQLVASGALATLKSLPASTTPAAPAVAEAAPVEAAKPVEAAEPEHGARVPLIKFLGKRSLLPETHAAPVTAAAAAPVPGAVAAAAAPAVVAVPASGDFTDLALSNMRKIIAKRLTASKVDVPHHYASIDCEIDDIMALRQKLKTAHSVKVSLNDFILKAVALALRDVPEANSFFDVKSQSVQPNASVDISVAVATASGLITPIVPKVDARGLSGINDVFMKLVSRARANKLKPEEFQGGSFTISNLGGFGIDNFTAVINPPQACIMAIGRGRKELLPPLNHKDDDEELGEPRLATLLNVTLSADRRVVDDVIAGQFLQTFKRYMENPELLSL